MNVNRIRGPMTQEEQRTVETAPRSPAHALLQELLAASVLSQLVLAVYIDQDAPAVRDPEFYLLEGMFRERVAENPGRPTAMFLGSSRVAHGFNARRATGDHDAVVFNFGVPGSGPYFQTVMMDRLRTDGVRPDILFLEVLHSFYNTAGVRSLDGSLLDGARLTGSWRGPASASGPGGRAVHQVLGAG